MIVIDTDVLIDALRGREPARSRVKLEIETGRVATTAVTAFELKSGARTEAERALIEALLAAFAILPFDGAAADEAGEIRRNLESTGAPIGMADYMIAGTVRSRGGLLVTGNRRHFERVERLQLSLYEKPPPKKKS